MAVTNEADDEATQIDHPLAEKVQSSVERTSSSVWAIGKALTEAEKMVKSNHKEVQRRGHTAADDLSPDEVLDAENVYEVQVRNPDWQDPTITVWLHDCPHYANSAESRKLINLGHGNDLHCVVDVRPF